MAADSDNVFCLLCTGVTFITTALTTLSGVLWLYCPCRKHLIHSVLQSVWFLLNRIILSHATYTGLRGNRLACGYVMWYSHIHSMRRVGSC